MHALDISKASAKGVFRTWKGLVEIKTKALLCQKGVGCMHTKHTHFKKKNYNNLDKETTSQWSTVVAANVNS